MRREEFWKARKGRNQGDKVDDVNSSTFDTCDSNVHEESTWTPRILIEEERGIGTQLREISKD